MINLPTEERCIDVKRFESLRMRSKVMAAISLVALAAGIGGCGGSSGGAHNGKVTIGLLVDESGELGTFGKAWAQAMQMAADEINQVGGLPGNAKIQTVVQDEKTDPPTALAAARKMISVNGASAIIGPTSSSMVALVPLAHRDQVPILSGSSGSVQLNSLGGNYIYRTVNSDAADGLVITKAITEKGGHTVSILAENTASTLSPVSTFKSSFGATGGKVLADVVLNDGQSSYQTEVSQALGPKPQWIVCACGVQVGSTVLQELAAAGYHGPIIGTADLVDPGLIKAVGAKLANGVYGEVASTDTNTAAYKRFAAAFQKRFNTAPGPFTANYYDAMILTALAMVASHNTTGAAINGALRQVADPPGEMVTSYAAGVAALKAGKKINYEGASGPVDFDSTGTVKTPYVLDQVKGGQFQQVQFFPPSTFK